MDEHVLSDYFLTLGNSFYESTEFRTLIGKGTGTEEFTPIARFGIGVASVFMLADLLDVQTRTFHSVFNDSTARTVRIERMGALAFVTESTSGSIGTKIRIRLKPDLNERYEAVAGSIHSYLSQSVVRPAFDLQIQLGGKNVLISSDNRLRLKLLGSDEMRKSGVEHLPIDIGSFSSLISGDVVLFFHRNPDGKLSHQWNSGRAMHVGDAGLRPSTFYENYRGNLVALNGFRMVLKKMAQMLGLGKSERIPMIFEINIKAGPDIGYDVSRNQVIGEGRFKIALEFREALLRAVAHLKLRDRLELATEELLDKIITIPAAGFVRGRGYLDVDPQQLSQAIQELVPSGIWRKGMETSIASRLNLPISVIIGVAQDLLDRGELTRRPDEEHWS
jgi:molecular chaperone HtpG